MKYKNDFEWVSAVLSHEDPRDWTHSVYVADGVAYATNGALAIAAATQMPDGRYSKNWEPLDGGDMIFAMLRVLFEGAPAEFRECAPSESFDIGKSLRGIAYEESPNVYNFGLSELATNGEGHIVAFRAPGHPLPFESAEYINTLGRAVLGCHNFE